MNSNHKPLKALNSKYGLTTLIVAIHLICIGKFTYSQNASDTLVFSQQLNYQEFMNSRLESYYYGSFDLTTKDTIQLEDTTFIQSTWSLDQLFFLCLREDTESDGYRILGKFLHYHNDNNHRIKIIDEGYSSSFPANEQQLAKEQQTGYFNVPCPLTMGCLRTEEINALVKFVNSFEY